MAIPSEITAAGETARASAQTAGALASQGATIGDVLKQKVLDVYANNQDIIGKLDTATADYTSAPGVAREKYQNIFNPFQRESLVSQYTANKQIPMLSMASMYGQRMGRVSDLIGAGTNAFNAQVGAQQSAAESLRQAYQDMLNEYVTAKQLEPKVSPTELKFLDLGNQMVGIDPYSGRPVTTFPIAKKPVAGSGESIFSDIDWNRILNPRDNENDFSPTEPMPIYSPGKIGAVSQQGDWIYTGNGITGWESAWEAIK
jgi:hypothetical protein